MTSNSTTPPTPIAASPNRRPVTSADGGRAKPAAMIGPGKMRDVAPGGVDSGSDSTNRATDSAKLFSAPLWPVVLVASPGPPLPRRVRPEILSNQKTPMLLAIRRQRRAAPWNGAAHAPSTLSMFIREFSNEI